MINGELETNRGTLSRNFYYIRVEDLTKVYHRASNIELDPKKIDTKIAVYEDRMNTWLVDVVEALTDVDGGEIAMMQVLIPHMARCQEMRDGRKGSDSFDRAAKRIFALDSSYSTIVRDFQKFIASGNFDNIVISKSLKKAIEKGDFAGSFKINPKRFAEGAVKDIQDYIAQVKKPANKQLRNNFDRSFRLI